MTWLENRVLRKMMVCLLLACLCLSPAVAFGVMDTERTASPVSSWNQEGPDRTVILISASFEKISNVQAYALVYGTSSSTNATILSAVELQSRTSVDDDFETELGPVYRRIWNSSSIEHEVYFPITSGKQYRIKVTITDTVEGVVHSVTDYFDLVENPSS